MKLSAKEVKLISDVSKNRKQRKWGAWLGFLTATGLLVATEGFGIFPSLRESSILVIAVVATFAHLIHVYFAVRPEDKLVDLLQRYINRDPEAVARLSWVTDSDGVAA